MRTTMVGLVSILVIGAVAGAVHASTLESTTGVCYQNDGQVDFDTKCDMPDSYAALQSHRVDCNTDVNVDTANTTGTLVPLHNQPGVPEEDPSDFCFAHLVGEQSTIPLGTRITVRLHINADNPGVPISLHLWDAQSGDELQSTPPAGGFEFASEDMPVHSGSASQTYHPISVSKVTVNGVDATSRASAPASVETLAFVVKNDPQVITLQGDQYALHTGDQVLLCNFEGTLFYSLVPGTGGNIKLTGTSDAFAVAPAGARLPSCAQAFTNLSCSSQGGVQTQCQLDVNSNVPDIVFEARAHPMNQPGAAQMRYGLVAAHEQHCHDVCGQFVNFLPMDWNIDITNLGTF